MKKRITFQLFMLLFFPFGLRPMESKICGFTILPMEVLKYLVSFWEYEYESEEEFIQRTRIIKIVPDKYYKFFPPDNSKCLAWKAENVESNVNSVFNPDETKIALLELLCGFCEAPNLIIVDLKKDKEEEKTVYKGKLLKEHYCAFGLSTSGTIIAVIKKQQVDGENCFAQKYKDFLTIQKMVGKEEKKFEEVKKFNIPDCFIPQRLAFNKQNTHVIMYGQDKSPSVRKYIIFPLKELHVDEKPIAINETNPLLSYFGHKCVCKDIKKITS